MASVIDICNLALSRIGDSATVSSIDPPEGSAQAEHCAMFYPIARDSLLEMHAWKFATKRVRLAPLDVDTFDWQFAYAFPAGCIRLISVLPVDTSSDADGEDYLVELGENGTQIIYTNQQDATARFIFRQADVSKYPPLVVDALSWLLASHLAGPVVKGDSGAKLAVNCYQSFRALMAAATTSDANQGQSEIKHNPVWIGDR